MEAEHEGTQPTVICTTGASEALEQYKAICEAGVARVIKKHKLNGEVRRKGPWVDATSEEGMSLYPVFVTRPAKEAVSLTGCWRQEVQELCEEQEASGLLSHQGKAAAVFYGRAT